MRTFPATQVVFPVLLLAVLSCSGDGSSPANTGNTGGTHAVLVGSLHQVRAAATAVGGAQLCGSSECRDEQPLTGDSTDPDYTGGGTVQATCNQATAQASANAQGVTNTDAQSGIFTSITSNVSAQANVASTGDAAASASGTLGSTNGTTAFEGWTFDVVEGNLNYLLTGNATHSGVLSNSSPGSISFSLEDVNAGVLHDFQLTNASNSLNESGVLPPGRYRINMTASAGASEPCGPGAGSANASASGSFTLTLTPQ